MQNAETEISVNSLIVTRWLIERDMPAVLLLGRNALEPFDARDVAEWVRTSIRVVAVRGASDNCLGNVCGLATYRFLTGQDTIHGSAQIDVLEGEPEAVVALVRRVVGRAVMSHLPVVEVVVSEQRTALHNLLKAEGFRAVSVERDRYRFQK